jgi:hypothetical protein
MKTIAAAALVLAGSVALDAARADTVTLVGTDFDVIYNSATLGLFGTPQLIGDYLVFTPNQFAAQSLNGTGTDTTTSVATGIQLVANPGYQFGNLSVAAVGDYLMQGPGTSVGVSGTLTATDAARPLTQTVANLVVASPLNIANGIVQNWSGSAQINNSTPTVTPGYNPWLASAGTIDVQLANWLTATTTPGTGDSQAFIQEKFSSVELVIDPVAVPLPSGLLLGLSGLAGLACLGRRRQL